MKDKGTIDTITTGMENRFGAGIEALQPRRSHWPTVRDQLAGRTSEQGKPVGIFVAVSTARVARLDDPVMHNRIAGVI